jgi:hypothetical protein
MASMRTKNMAGLTLIGSLPLVAAVWLGNQRIEVLKKSRIAPTPTAPVELTAMPGASKFVGTNQKFTSVPYTGYSAKAFTLQYPEGWMEKSTIQDNGRMLLVVAKNEYRINIDQSPVSKWVCIFGPEQAAATTGGALVIDATGKTFREVETEDNRVLRYFADDVAGNTQTYDICEEDEQKNKFGGPAAEGVIQLVMPVHQDPVIVSEMENILRTMSLIKQN